MAESRHESELCIQSECTWGGSYRAHTLAFSRQRWNLRWQSCKGSPETTQHNSQVSRHFPGPTGAAQGATLPFSSWSDIYKGCRFHVLFPLTIQPSDWTLKTTQSIFEQVFNMDPKCDCSLASYFVSHSTDALLSPAVRDWSTDWSVADLTTAHCH